MPESDPWSGTIRNRVSGLLVRDNQLLLVQVDLPTIGRPAWMPPGGAVELGEAMEEAVVREMKEETGITVSVGQLVYISEYIGKPYHAIEHYFLCSYYKGEAALGSDPEVGVSSQILLDIGWFPLDDLPANDLVPAFIAQDFPDAYQSGDIPTRFISR